MLYWYISLYSSHQLDCYSEYWQVKQTYCGSALAFIVLVEQREKMKGRGLVGRDGGGAVGRENRTAVLVNILLSP